MCFSEDSTSEMTQIHLWQSYQGTFNAHSQTHPHLIAGDFIKNVSNTFSGASAQVAGSNKYVIRGIKPRTIPVDYKGRELVRCQWRVSNPDLARDYGHVFSHSSGEECGGWYGTSAALLAHIVTSHLHVPQKHRDSSTPMDVSDSDLRPSSSAAGASGHDFAAAARLQIVQNACKWSTCNHSRPSASAVDLALLARHVETHLPDSSDTASWKKRHNQLDTSATKPVPTATHVWHRTMMDESNDAAGVPLGCALVMRNIARAIPQLTSSKGPSISANATLHSLGGKDETEESDATKSDDRETGTASLMKKVFGQSKDRLFHAMAHNLVISSYVGIILKLISQGGG